MRSTMLTPTKIAGYRRTEFLDVSCGEDSTFLRESDGQFYAFGLNNCGQLAMPHPRSLNNEDTLTPEARESNLVTLLKPTRIEAFDGLDVVRVAPGKDHGIALSEAGCVYSWGVSTYGVLGRSDVSEWVDETKLFPVPQIVSGFEGPIVDIASGQVSNLFVLVQI